MMSARPATFASLARRVAADPPTDADLLARFVAERDGEAFAELVRRHGPAVLAACRRLTGHAHNAEDAFQATFLVLARKADRVRPGEPVGGWLYGVAVRAARNAAARAWRRRGREALTAAVPDVPAPATERFDPESAAAVLAEVGRLPEHLRAAVVLCELEGRSRAAAARELGIAEGTLSSRLAAARKRLAERLATRGFGPAALAALAGVAVPPRLATAASTLATGGPASAAAASLAHGVSRAMLVPRFLFTPVVFGLVASAALAAGLVPGPTPARPTAPAVPVGTNRSKAAPAPKAPPGPNRLFVWRKAEVISIDPTGANEKPVLTGITRPWDDAFSVSPDGKRVAAAGYRVSNPGDEPAQGPQLLLERRDVSPGPTVEDVGEVGHSVWSADGTALAVCAPARIATAEDKATHFVFDLTTRVQTPLKLPDTHFLTDWSRDGRYFLTLEAGAGRDGAVFVAAWVMNRDGTPHKKLTRDDTGAMTGRFSPDGKRVLGFTHGVRDPDPAKRREREREGSLRPSGSELVVIDLATGAATPVKDFPRNAGPRGLCWSPDGRQIAYTWQELLPEGDDRDRETRSHLTVCDPDGGNRRTIQTVTHGVDQIGIGQVYWR